MVDATVHMGGRIYDPTLGRFMQADPIIQSPLDSQSYNRFAYVRNNPMTLTDPSGFSWWSSLTKPFKKLGRNIIRAAVKVFGANIVNFVGTVVSTYFGGPAGAGAWTYEFSRAMGASSTGALRAGLTAFASTYALQQIGASDTWGTAGTIENISANAMVGGISAELQGGKFGHGFISAGFASMAKPAIYDKWGYSPDNQVQRVMAAAVVGGTASVLSGGKFANGAMTGAFNQMYNGETYAARKWGVIQDFVNNNQHYVFETRDKVASFYNENSGTINSALTVASFATGIGAVGAVALNSARLYTALSTISFTTGVGANITNWTEAGTAGNVMDGVMGYTAVKYGVQTTWFGRATLAVYETVNQIGNFLFYEAASNEPK